MSWQDNLPQKEMPPPWMWCLTDELVDHFEEVKRRRKDGHSDDNDEGEPGMIQNELAKGRGR